MSEVARMAPQTCHDKPQTVMSGSVTCHPACHVIDICCLFGVLATRVWYT